MPVFLLSFLKNNWLAVSLAALLAIAGVYIGIERLDIRALNGDISTLKADNLTLSNNNAVLTAAIDKQNAAVVSLQEASASKQKKAALDLAAARQAAQKYTSQLTALRGQKMTGDDCQNMKNALDIYFAKVKK